MNRNRIKYSNSRVLGPSITPVTTGNSSTDSISKTKNSTTKIKNRTEKGRRIDLIGSNPHSKGEFFEKFGKERKQIIK